MNRHDLGAPFNRFVSRPGLTRRRLMAGASVLALLAAPLPAQAGALVQALVTSGTSTSAVGSTVAASQASLAAAQAVTLQAQKSLAQAAGALKAALAVQAAARAAAPASSFNGLGAGALNPVANPNSTSDGLTTWSGATLPTESDANGQYNVTIHQTAAQATLSWTSFNIGSKTTLTFDQQGNADWVALNRVVGASAAPSQILGSIKADGSVYVINQNGILFGGGSQVNVHTLIASSAGLSDAQLLNNGIYSAQSGSSYLPSFINAGGAVTVAAGALITTEAPTSVTAGGGFVLLMGTQVENVGSISTPNGQTMLAAGDNFLIRPGYGTTANASSTTRGNEIAVQLDTPGGSAKGGSGLVGNSGLIEATTGDITLAGETVIQAGVLLSSTSVDVRGTIHLLSSASDPFGSVTLAADSLTLIAPELSSMATALDSQRAALIADSAVQNAARSGVVTAQFDDLSLVADREDQSRVEIVSGGTVAFQGNSLTMANGGQVAVSAARRVQADAGATIDVSGSYGVLLPMSANDIAVNIQGNELRDDPNNRDSGALNNSTVYADARDLVLVPAGTGGYATDRYYTPGGVLEVSGYLNNVGHTIGEWTAIGGTITLSTGAAGAVVAQAGSVFNISGGSLQYQGGYVKQSYLLGTDGNIYNINTAPADMTYVGPYDGLVVTHAHWGVTEIYRNPLSAPAEIYEAGYTVGRDAGSLILSTPTALFEGGLLAGVIDGARQTGARAAGVTDSYKYTQFTVALPGTLAIGRYDATGLVNAYNTAVTFGDDGPSVASSLSVEDPVPAGRNNMANFDAGQKIDGYGLGGLSVATRGSVSIQAPLTFAPGAQISIVAPIVDVAADIKAPAGHVSISNILKSLGIVLTTPVGLAQITLEGGAAIDMRGLWTNAILDPSDLSSLAFLDGGSVILDSSQGITLMADSVLDVSSGAALLSSSKTKGGKGGDISLTVDDNTPGTAPLVLDGTLRADGVTGGGTLTILAPSVSIGDGIAATAPGQLVLPSSFFALGFSKYDISGLFGVTVAAGTVVAVTEPVYQIVAASLTVPTGTDPGAAMVLSLPVLYLENPQKDVLTQRAGASLTLRADETGQGVLVDRGAVLSVDPGQSVRIESDDQITINGTISAPGGAITLVNTDNIANGPRFVAGLSIWLGENSRLDVSAIAAVAVDALGRSYGVVPDGGSVIIGTDAQTADAASNAMVVIRPGAVIDASGTSAVLDVTSAEMSGRGLTSSLSLTASLPVTVASNGGSIALSSYNAFYVDGTMRAAAGGAGASGGALSVVLETSTKLVPRPDAERTARTITLSQGYGPSGLADDVAAGQSDPSLAAGYARFSADRIEAGGFDSITLDARDIILFDGPVSLSAGRSISLEEGILASKDAASPVRLNAPYVLLSGRLNGGSDAYINNGLNGFSHQVSTADFTVNAALIDVQNSIQFGVHGSYLLADGITSTTVDAGGFDTVTLSSQGDIRFGNGSLMAPQNLTLVARQIYPMTEATATASAVGTLTVGRIGDDLPATPYAVFGSLTLTGKIIDQGGVIRAPLGQISLGGSGTAAVTLLPGSLTSVSAAGLDIPYGGTTDGVTYSYNGTSVTFVGASLSLGGTTIDVAPGAVLDLSGGGTLAGSGFISGRGGSVDVLATALANANPSNSFSASGNAVYAILPGFQSAYAPVDAGAGNAPGIGRQITIPAGTPGLPAGTYTLLPARYALLPGAFRVEIGATSATRLSGAMATGTGSYLISGEESVANTGIGSVLPIEMILTPGAAVRAASQYDEMSYSAFALAHAATLDQARPPLPADAKTLLLAFAPGGTGAPLTFEGTTLFAPADGGLGGSVSIDATSSADIEIVAAAPTPGFTGISLRASDLDAIDAPRLIIGSRIAPFDWTNPMDVAFVRGNTTTVTVRDGAVLSGPEIFLVANADNFGHGGAITIEAGAEITTLGRGNVAADSSDGYVYDANGNSLVALSNGWLNLLPARTGGANNRDYSGVITIGACPAGPCSDQTRLLSDGTIGFVSATGVQFGDNVRYGARYLTFAVPSVNIGTAAALAGAAVPAGLSLTQSLLTQLLDGDAALGAPKLERLTLTASASINFYGAVDLDTTDPATGTSSLQQLVFNTPALYGYGAAGDVATVTTGTLIWNGIATGTGQASSPYASALPGAVSLNGPGTGSGTLTLKADRILFGYPDTDRANDNVTLDRLILGFSTVNLVATDRITANSKGTLSVYQSQGDYVQGSGYSYSGGTLNLITPLLTGEAASVSSITAGGALTISPPAGSAADSVGGDALGAELTLKAVSITQSGVIALPSGALTLEATTGDILLTAGSVLDLAGRAVANHDVTDYSWGGTVTLTSDGGNVTQQAGARIDVSAAYNNAGTVTVEALAAGAGRVRLDGLIKGDSTGSYDAGGGAIVPYDRGGIDVRAQSIDDFTGLNRRLDDSGVTGARAFDIKQGDLVVGDEVKAQTVVISVDGGSLTVTGTIDASGAEVGSIRLSARDDLTLAGGATLDTHGTVLRVDSDGQPIDASNRAVIALTSSQGWLRLDPGASIDLRSADGVARGTIDLDAPRLGSATAGDIAIAAGGPLTIRGAQSIAVNGFWTYTDAPTDPNGTVTGRPDQIITQAYLDTIDRRDSVPFIANALANADLQGRLAGLENDTGAFHLRPGITIASATADGDLTVQGDLDFSGYRYASLNPNTQKTGVYGSGEPGVIVIRAGGDLNIYGSITDGFNKPVATPDDNGWVLIPPQNTDGGNTLGQEPYGFDVVVPRGVTLAAGTTFGAVTLNFAAPIAGGTLKADTVIPTTVTLATAYVIPSGGWVATAAVQTADGHSYAKGQTIPAGTTLDIGTTLAAGTILPGQVTIQELIWPAGVSLGVFSNSATLALNTPIPTGAVIPAGTVVAGFVDGAGTMLGLGLPTRDIGAGGTQGQNWAVASMLPAGSLSWSMRLVAGADLASADTRELRSKNALTADGGSGNINLGDQHYSIQMLDWSGNACNPGIDACGDPSTYADYYATPNFSVIRTGTGDLDLLAGGNITEHSLYGIYTAGTQAADVSPEYQLARGTTAYTDASFNTTSNTVLGPTYSDPATPGQDYAAVLADYQAYYPEQGGNVLLSAQGDITGRELGSQYLSGSLSAKWLVASNGLGTWLWRQGGDIAGQATAWWINFGTYVQPLDLSGGTSSNFGSTPQLVGFTGVGALGGGNVTVLSGGDIDSLDVAVASTGRVGSVTTSGNSITGGTIAVTGGGDMTIRGAQAMTNGVLSDLRGNIAVQAESIGQIALQYGVGSQTDPRAPDPLTANAATSADGPVLMLGDGSATLETRGDLVLDGAGDPGRVAEQNLTPYSFTDANGTVIPETGGGNTWFTLWRAGTAVNLFSAGGNVTPSILPTNAGGDLQASGNIVVDHGVYSAPPSLWAVALDGSIYYGDAHSSATGNGVIELAPSPVGQLVLLAGHSIYGTDSPSANGTLYMGFDMSGADASDNGLANPFRPAFVGSGLDQYGNISTLVTNANIAILSPGNPNVALYTLFAFEADTPTTALHAGDPDPMRFYAGDGDIVNLRIGDTTIISGATPITRYRGAKTIRVMAGRDIVNPSGMILEDDPTDISVVSAGRDIFYANFDIAGPGLLEVTAGRNLYQADQGVLHSLGPIIDVNAQNRSDGAGIVVMAGVGATGPDYSDFANRYLNPAGGLALKDASQIVQGYDDQLAAWLKQRFGYAGTTADAFATFQTLDSDQQGVFLRQIYFAELTAAGREYNDAGSIRDGSYLRGREAIAALFPGQDAEGNAISYNGSITLFGNSGIHTDFGGGIQTLAPGGETIIGVEGGNPAGTAGFVTQGSGDIDIYSLGSVLLGQSRIMTTDGGAILAWSATGDINAGRGAKTTVVYTPPRRAYDDLGDVTLSPQAPSSGAGIATLNPIPEVTPGDIDLIAPLGTVDAGEAGIRVSGNLNIAALHVINTANIQVQGTTTGVPMAATPNLGALTTASNTAGVASSAADAAARSSHQTGPRQTDLPSIITVEVIGYGGGGTQTPDDKAKEDEERRRRKARDQQSYDANGPVQVIGGGTLTREQQQKLTATELKNFDAP